MTKSISFAALFGAMVLALSFAVAMPTKALEIPSFYDAIFDEQTESWTNPGDRIPVTALVKVDSGEVFHAFSTDVIGDGLARECHDVSNVQGEIEKSYKFDHRDGPPNTGDYGFQVIGYTAENMNEANSKKGDAACTGDNTTIYNEGDVVHIVADGSNGSDDGDGDVGSVSSLQALIAKLTAQVSCLVSGKTLNADGQCVEKPVPAKPSYCEKIKNYTVWYGMMNSDQVRAFQRFLIDSGFNISAGVTGNYLDQTDRAAKSMGDACK